MSQSRRHFLRNAGALAAAAPAYATLSACSTPVAAPSRDSAALVPDAEGFLDLPPGFSYQRFSEVGTRMSDGFRVPGAHDGMGCFAIEGDPDRCVLIRNHELSKDETDEGPFERGQGVPAGVDPDLIFDIAPNGDPIAGGTTNLVYNTRTGQLEQSFLSLVGAERNCSGGITPWGSWLTCEESRTTPDAEASQYHGYAFDVPASARGLVKAEPLRAMGRFNREAVAVDPSTGIVYQTEDSGTGLLYRFIPDQPGELARGGRLQALAIIGMPSADTRNWQDATFAVGQAVETRWIDLDDVEALDSPLQKRGFAKGAALFARGEGIAWAVDQSGASTYFACTNGGQVPAVKNFLGDGALGKTDVILKQAFHLFGIVFGVDGFEIDHFCIAQGGEMLVGVINIGDTARHTGGEITSRAADDDDPAAGHVFAAVIADALDDRASRPSCAHRIARRPRRLK